MHEPLPRRAAVKPDVNIAHVLHRDIETRSQVDLRKVGAARYAADPSTEVLCAAYAADSGPVQLWRPGDPVPMEFFEAAANPNWRAAAHNDAFETAIERVLHLRHGFPGIVAFGCGGRVDLRGCSHAQPTVRSHRDAAA